MLSKKALQELLATTAKFPGGFMVLEEDKPKLVVLDYENFRRLSPKGTQIMKTQPKKNILITGGAGYIGSHAARLLMQRGFNVTTLDNLSTGFVDLAQGRFVNGDLADQGLLDKIFAQGNFDAVMHFAASIEVGESVENPLKYYQNNTVNGLNLLQAMVKHKVNNIIFSSSCAVYAETAPVPISEAAPFGPISPYGETKVIFEHMLKWFGKAYGIKSVSLRYFNAAGASLDAELGLANPNSTLLIPNVLNVALGLKESLVVNGKDYNTYDGTAIRDYIHVQDLAEAHLLSLEFLESAPEADCEAFNVGTGHGYSVMEVINAVCEATGHMVRFECGPRRGGDREKVVADSSKIKKVLGFEPQYSDLKTIITTAWAWHQKRFGGR